MIRFRSIPVQRARATLRQSFKRKSRLPSNSGRVGDEVRSNRLGNKRPIRRGQTAGTDEKISEEEELASAEDLAKKTDGDPEEAAEKRDVNEISREKKAAEQG